MTWLFLLACGLASRPAPEEVPVQVPTVDDRAVVEAYRAWLDPAPEPHTGIGADELEDPLLRGVRTFRVIGAIDGGHAHLPGAWAWVADGTIRFVDQERSVQISGASHEMTHLWLCTREERAAGACIDRLPALRAAHLDGVAEADAEERARGLAAWMLRFAHGGYGAGVLEPGWTPEDELIVVRWSEPVAIEPPRLRRVGQSLVYTAFFRVERDPYEKALVRAELTVEGATTRLRWDEVGQARFPVD